MDADAEVWLQDHMHQRFTEIAMDFESTVPSTDPPQPLQLQEEAGPSNSPEFSPQVFMGTPFSLPTIPQTPAMDTLARGAETDPLPRHFPPGAKLAKKQALSKHTDLSMFDILNIFRCHWFLSVGHLWAQALLAQKADSGKIFWVKFTPQFHAHLVKCTVVLIPWPILKVKKVMFIYILELLNKEGNQAFFNLSKGDRRASTAQKKKRLAWKRNHASRWEHQKQAEEAMEGHPQWSCDFCRCKFTLHKTAKQHQCPLFKGASRGTGAVEGKGRRIAPLFPCKPNKPAANPPPPAPPAPPSSAPSHPTALQPRKKCTQAPLSACEAALASTPHEPMDSVFASSTQAFGSTPTHTSARLNTSKKCRIQRGIMESIDTVGQI
jgi:hypothetical protein